jgi:hypothetical protein
MPETRRTNSGFLSNNEYARDRKRTQDFVHGILTMKSSRKKVVSAPLSLMYLKRLLPWRATK